MEFTNLWLRSLFDQRNGAERVDRVNERRRRRWQTVNTRLGKSQLQGGQWSLWVGIMPTVAESLRQFSIEIRNPVRSFVTADRLV